MMKSRKFGIGLLIMLAMVVTTGTFAYWTSGLAADSEVTAPTVTIGTGSTTASIVALVQGATTGSALVPTGHGGDTATFTIAVDWDEVTTSDFSGDVGDLVVTVVWSMTGLTDAQLEAMFSHSIPVTTITEGAAAQDVVVTVIFDTEPSTQAFYDLVESGTLTATFTFTVTPQ
ncbi:MAG: hypothetical protein KQ78_00647 [Candidatus Izimaplasma bacterium HR2]|nr:MAG: hypothetical protein KQ78_00647 [Candidatus Izimaplasma bacterium HR2]